MINNQILLFILRVWLGIVFMHHGAQKVFGLFGGSGLKGWVTWLSSLQVPAWLAYGAAFAEFFGGVLLFLGLAAPLGALLEIFVMIGAIYLVHWPHGLFGDNGFEYPFLLMVCCLLILLGGSGAWASWDPFKNYY